MGAIIPYIVASLVGGFAASIVQGIVKLLIAVGIGFITYQGVDILASSIMNNIIGNFSNLPIAGVLGLLKIDKCLNVLSSAYATRLVLRGFVNGATKRIQAR